jgi:hypothetical protein
MTSNQSVTATFTLANSCANGATDYPTCTPPLDRVSPGAQAIGTAGGCAGGSLSGSFTVTAANGVSWSAAVDQNNLPPLGGGTVSLGGGSGSGSGSFSVTVTVPPQPPSSSFSSCSLNYYLDTFTNVWVTFSDGSVIGVTAYWTFKGTT